MTGGIVCGKISFTEEEINYFLEKVRYDPALEKEMWQLLFELCAKELEEGLPEKQVFNLCQKILGIDQKQISYFIDKFHTSASLQRALKILKEAAKQKNSARKISGEVRINNGKFFSAQEVETLINALECDHSIGQLLVKFLNREIYGTATQKNGSIQDQKLFEVGVKIVTALNDCPEETAIELIKNSGSPGWPSKYYAEKMQIVP